MLGQDAHTSRQAPEGDARRPPATLADTCRDVRERLEAIGRALGGLCTEIDRTLERGSALPETSAPPSQTAD